MTRIPDDFVLGAATAAFQIEGATHTDGRTDSIWDAFARVPGAVVRGDDGEPACEHYRRMPEDVALMRELGLNSYRFSTSWARVCPDGGAPNPAGLDFYARLVDALLEAEIAPWLTLYHWDLPQSLQESGGWANRDTAERFVDFALAVHGAIGDRVPTITTLNEPWCSSFLSYTAGAHAPGHRSVAEGLAAGHHLLLAHGMAVRALRDAGAERLGITLNLTVADPVDPASASDRDAARRIDEQFNRFFLDPIFRGEYRGSLRADVGHLGLDAVVRDGDLATIQAPIEVLGVNYYHGDSCSFEPPATPLRQDAPTDRQIASPFPAAEGVHMHPTGAPTTSMGWEIQPHLLTRLLAEVHEEYTGSAGVELWVTENGAAFDDVVAPDGAVHDAERTSFVREHVAATIAAREQGVPVQGYFAWSLLDNYEWAWGYEKRFGIVRVDYETQERTVKDSGRELQRMLRERTV